MVHVSYATIRPSTVSPSDNSKIYMMYRYMILITLPKNIRILSSRIEETTIKGDDDISCINTLQDIIYP